LEKTNYQKKKIIFIKTKLFFKIKKKKKKKKLRIGIFIFFF